MITSNDLKKGLTIQYEGSIWKVLDFQHVKHGRGQAIVRAKLRNLRQGNIKDLTFRAGEKLETAHIETKTMQYLYENAGQHIFMDLETYEQIGIPEEKIEDELKFLKENENVDIVTYEGEVIGASLPVKVQLRVIETEPGIRGDTQSGGSKTAKLETGAVITVPLFVNVDDVLIVNTEDGSYDSRVQ
ncbi:elongation factor P [Allofustis seminis]|uniref:elongation factor P n=1 Tax=Allofustis seminis TaxID=166939 RepID=UPI00037A3C75|nr:elongation factor P [Allofustis seminis]